MSTRPTTQNGTRTADKVLRVASIALFSVLMVLAAVDVRRATATSSGDGINLTVIYSAVSRPGLATPFGMEISTADGGALPRSITTRISAGYVESLDENGLDPDPVTGYRTDEWTWWTFEIPDGRSSFEVFFDARLEPAVQWTRAATAAVEIDEREVVSIDFKTWVLP